jgi:hypothetical protein
VKSKPDNARERGARQELAPIVYGLAQWGERWVLGHVDHCKPDVTTPMWAVRRRVDPTAFREKRIVVRFEFTDQPSASRFWWLINEAGAVDLCLKDPGFEVDLYVTTDLQTMARTWAGAVTLSAAIDSDWLQLDGPRSLRQAFKCWLLLSPLAAQPNQSFVRPPQSAPMPVSAYVTPAESEGSGAAKIPTRPSGFKPASVRKPKPQQRSARARRAC